MVSVGPGGKGAVVAPLRAKWDVDIDPEGDYGLPESGFPGRGYDGRRTPRTSNRLRSASGVVSSMQAIGRRSSRRIVRMRPL